MLASATDEKRLPDLLPHLSPDSPSGPTFPLPPSHSGVPIPMGRSATNALSRALSLASKKLFGAGVGSPRSPPRFATLSYGGQGTGSSSPCTCSASVGGGIGEVDPKPLPDPSKFAPREGENEKVAARRRNADVQAEYNAGIDELRKYQEHMEMRHPEGDFVLSEASMKEAEVTQEMVVQAAEAAAQEEVVKAAEMEKEEEEEEATKKNSACVGAGQGA
ncbi:hypothetical protein BGW80DRAFT_1562686 [Lactifluus volemus]|nr:hypothetical protein BGW80DRAFT_1562686 [Lactifluus volemus]